MKLISSGGGSRASGRHTQTRASSAHPTVQQDTQSAKRMSDTLDLPRVSQTPSGEYTAQAPRPASTQTAQSAYAQRPANVQSAQSYRAPAQTQSAYAQRPANTQSAQSYRAPTQAQSAYAQRPANTQPAQSYRAPAQNGYAQQGYAQRPAYQNPQLGRTTSASDYARTSVGGVRVVHDADGRSSYSGEAYARAAAQPQPDAKSAKKEKKHGKLKRRLIGWGTALVCLVCLYLFCVYTSLPFIANLRNIYIETAMTTMEHQWLATYFIPLPVIQETMGRLDALEKDQENLESDWSQYSTISASQLPALKKEEPPQEENPDDIPSSDLPDVEPVDEKEFWEDPDHEFWKIYSEIDYDSFCEYAITHRDTMYNEEGYLFIDEADTTSDGTGILTKNGDPVIAIDSENGIVLVRMEGKEYWGVMAIVKNPRQISLGLAPNLGRYGSKIAKIAENNDAILAINASGFEDNDGLGNGGTVYGMLYVDGEKIQGSAGGTYKAIYFDSNYRLNVRTYVKNLDILNGVEFKPALVINGEAAVSGSAGWGVQPRAAIGQTEDGTVIMIIIDGRQTHSVGITVGALADLFVDYGAVQAGNLDGGSSAVMYYNGRLITKPSGADRTNGRSLPNAFVVKPAALIGGAEESEE